MHVMRKKYMIFRIFYYKIKYILIQTNLYLIIKNSNNILIPPQINKMDRNLIWEVHIRLKNMFQSIIEKVLYYFFLYIIIYNYYIKI